MSFDIKQSDVVQNRSDDFGATGACPPAALAGIRIIDLSQVAAGPYATSLLGDFGADVIKVEPPAGEQFRCVDRLYGPTDSAYFFGVNRSKRAIALDLKTAEGRAVMDRLLESADVLVVSMRPKAIAGLNLEYETLHARFPHLVYCMVTAFGESGPRAGQPGIDILVQAIGGLMGTTGEPGRPPVKIGPPMTDFATSFLACFGILAALRARQASGVGQKVSVNLLDTAVAMLANFVTPYLKTLVPVRPVGGGHPQMVPYQSFLAADGEWVVVACLTEQFWLNLCRAIGRAELADDPRFARNSERVMHRAEISRILEDVFRTRSSAEWERRLIRYDVPVARINRFEAVLQDPQVIHNEMITELNHPRYGKIPVVGNPVDLSATPGRARGFPPGIGEHTDEVLREIGLSPEEISLLRKKGSIR
ncbi:MAG: CaiB/BaiF CoA transferase family protein [Lautropia sp.]